MPQPLMNKTIGQCLEEMAERFPDRPAFLGGSGPLTWRQVAEASDRIAAQLVRSGVRKGSHVGLWSYSTPLFALCFYAVVKIGGVAVLLNSSARGSEAAYALDYADVRLLLVGRGRGGNDCEACCEEMLQAASLPRLKTVLSIGSGSCYPKLDTAAETAGVDLSAYQRAVFPEDVSAILFTSGTTSRPKGAMLTHYAMVNNSKAMSDSVRATADDCYCLALPLFHCFSLAGNLLSCLHSGAALAFLPDRHSIDILEAVQRHRCTLFHAVPTLLLAVIGNPRLPEFDLSSLRAGVLGGAATPPEQYRRLREALGMRLISSLGQTEATAGITMADYDADDLVNAETVGGFLPHVEGRILSLSDGAALPPGETGELCIRGYNVMKGYYRPETDAVIDGEGWLHTGDLGFLDRAGNLHLTGRRKEIIIRAGENISPAELEACIAADPRVAEVKCIGMPDPHYGEVVVACVAKASGAELSEAEVKARVAKEHAAYKIPRDVLFFPELPKTGSGKLSLHGLRELVEAHYNHTARNP